MKPIKLYKAEVGVLLPTDHPDYKDYAVAYDKQHAYYDENVVFFTNKTTARAYIKQYVQFGVVGTYGILTELVYDPKEIYGEDYEKYAQSDLYDIEHCGFLENYQDIFGTDAIYGTDNVIFTRYKKSPKTYKTLWHIK